MPSERMRNWLARTEAGNQRITQQTRYLRRLNMVACPLMVLVLLWMVWSQAEYGFVLLLIVILGTFFAAIPGLIITRDEQDSARAMREMAENLTDDDLR